MALVVWWSLLRTAVVGAMLARYGVHPLAYFVVDMASCVPYARASARLVEDLVDREHHNVWRSAGATALAYAAPDVYLLLAGRHMPRIAYVILGGMLLLLSLVTMWSIRRQVSTALARRESQPASEPAA